MKAENLPMALLFGKTLQSYQFSIEQQKYLFLLHFCRTNKQVQI
jgi:hypothetical protein